MKLAVRRRRKALGWTQEQLAEASGLSSPYMSQIETGEKKPSLPALERLARALKCDVQELFEEDSLTDAERAIIQDFADLPPDLAEALAAFVHVLAARQMRAQKAD